MKVDTGRLFEKDDAAVQSRVKCLVDAMNQLEYTAANGSFDDIATNPAFFEQIRKQATFPFVSTNVVKSADSQPYLPPYHIAAAGEKYRIAFLGVSKAASKPAKLPDGTTLVAIDPGAAMERYLKELEGKADLVVVMARLPINEARSLAERYDSIDLILGGDGAYMDPGLQPIFVNNAFILYGGDQGKYVGKVEAYPNGQVIDKLACRLVPLDAAIPDDPAMTALIKRYGSQLYSSAPKKPAAAQTGAERKLLRFEQVGAQTQRN